MGLQGMRQKLDIGGADAAARMLADWTEKTESCMSKNKKKLDEANRGNRKVTDTDKLAKSLNMAQKHKQDGYIEWHAGKVDEALACWRQADSYLKPFKAPDWDKSANKMVAEVHLAVLKNVAQAAIKLGYWTEALDAADDALRIDSQDHKAWFRKACALEGLGRYDEEEEALDKIDECAVGRIDRDRIVKDTDSKRANLQLIYERDKITTKRSLTRAITKGIFSGEREKEALTQESIPKSAFREGDIVMVMEPLGDLEKGQKGTVIEIDEDGDARIQFAGNDEIDLLMGEDLINLVTVGSTSNTQQADADVKQLQEESCVNSTTRKRLTKDSAIDLLDELQRAYSDPGYQQQMRKLVRDVRWNKTDFMTHMRKVALNVQKPVLEKWGFEPSFPGVAEMELAIQDHQCQELKEKKDAAARFLYGEMYEAITSTLGN